MKIANSLVQTGEKHDATLHRKCFEVNIRLLKECPCYFTTIEAIVSHMDTILDLEFDDYNKVQGISGANIGMPFNIIIIKTKNDGRLVMLNPEIIKRSTKMKTVKSNCGSINLAKKIEVERHEHVTVKFMQFDRELVEGGDTEEEQFPVIEHKFTNATVQHEIDHNNGILITDKVKS